MSAETLIRRSSSWLDANGRVLAQVQDPRVPVLERLKFLAILGANVDEFFTVCGSGLKRETVAGTGTATPGGLVPGHEPTAMRVRELIHAQRRYFLDDIQPMLAADGIVLRRPKDTSETQQRVLGDYFRRVILPLLTPLAIDPGHPFPYLTHRSLFLVAALQTSKPSVLPPTMLSVIPVPSAVLPRFIALPDSSARHAFILLEDVIRLHLPTLYRDCDILSSPTIRITRDSCRQPCGPSDSRQAGVERGARDRRVGAPVRLEHDEDVPARILGTLLGELGLRAEDVYGGGTFVGVSDLFQLYTDISSSSRIDTPRQNVMASFDTAPSIWNDVRLAGSETPGVRRGIVS